MRALLRGEIPILRSAIDVSMSFPYGLDWFPIAAHANRGGETDRREYKPEPKCGSTEEPARRQRCQRFQMGALFADEECLIEPATQPVSQECEERCAAKGDLCKDADCQKRHHRP